MPAASRTAARGTAVGPGLAGAVGPEVAWMVPATARDRARAGAREDRLTRRRSCELRRRSRRVRHSPRRLARALSARRHPRCPPPATRRRRAMPPRRRARPMLQRRLRRLGAGTWGGCLEACSPRRPRSRPRGGAIWASLRPVRGGPRRPAGKPPEATRTPTMPSAASPVPSGVANENRGPENVARMPRMPDGRS